MKRCAALLVCLAVVFSQSGADAQDVEPSGDVWVVLPTTSPEAGGIAEAQASELALMLRDAGVPALTPEEARTLFEARESSEPVAVDESDLDAVAREAQSALMYVATRRSQLARQSVLRVLERAERAMETLNREAESARNVLDACLYLVRAMLDSGDREGARTRVLECRRIVPDIEPDPFDHPPSVLEFLAEAERELDSGPHGSLRIESAPPDCAVVVNGRHLGTTPYDMPRLSPGEYRVQVECGGQRQARVHRLVLAAEPATLRVDAVFDTAVDSTRALRLRYASAVEEEGRRLEDSVRIARVVEAKRALLVTEEADGVVRADLLAVESGEVLASVHVPISGRRREDRRVLGSAVDALRTERSINLATNLPVERWSPLVHVAAQEAAVVARVDAEPATLRDDATRWPGWIAATVGATGFGVAWGFWARLDTKLDDFRATPGTDPRFLSRQTAYDDARLATMLAGAGGGVAGLVAMPLLLPERPRVPWWGWTCGVAGVGLVGLGTYLAVHDPGFADDGETRRKPAPVLGALALFHAAVLLNIPIVYLARGKQGSERAAITLEGGDHAWSLSLRGTM